MTKLSRKKIRRGRKYSDSQLSMDASIGVNLRVTAHSNQGGRKYMEDMFCVAYQPTADEKDLLYAYFGIFDGHGGREAALYAKTHLMDHIVSQKNFWSEDDELVLRSIKDGFISVHQAMWRELDKWPKTQSGLPSTSGTTASVAFVRRGKLYIGHVGDSGIVLGYQDPNSNFWKAKPLTMDHKPENPVENARIQESGGKVVSKSGVPRVVWNRPRLGHKGPVRRSTLIDEIPFLAVARSLGDLWSYNSEQNEFVVSPVPDTAVIEIDVNTHRCLILGSDGLWNMLSAQDAVNSVYFAEKNNERQNQMAQQLGHEGSPTQKNWINPSKRLVDRALDRWFTHNLRADNTSVVTVVIDPPGPPRVPKPLSPRRASSSLSPERGSPLSRISCAHTNNHSVSPHFRPIAQTRFANIDKPSPPRVHPPPPPYNLPGYGQRASPPQPGTSSQYLSRLQGFKTSPNLTLTKIRPATSVSLTLTRALRQQQQQQPPPQTRDLPIRGRRSHPVLSSKTSRVMHVRTPGTSASHSPAAASVGNQRVNASPPSLPVRGPIDANSDTDQPTDDQVQINEISSSCEDSSRGSSDLDDSIQATSTPALDSKQLRRGVKKVLPRAASTSAAATRGNKVIKSRKRPSRQSGEESNTSASTKLVKIIKLTVAEEAKSASPCRRSESERLVMDNQLQEAVSKLRHRTRDIRESIPLHRKKSILPALAASSLGSSLEGRKQRVTAARKAQTSPARITHISPPSNKAKSPLNVTKKSLRTVIEQTLKDDVLDKPVDEASVSVDDTTDPGDGNAKKSQASEVKPLIQKNVKAVSTLSKLDIAATTRIISLRHPTRSSLSNDLSRPPLALRRSKPVLKRLQQGRSTGKGLFSTAKREIGEKKPMSKLAANQKDANKSGDVNEGRSLRSGDARPRLTRRNFLKK